MSGRSQSSLEDLSLDRHSEGEFWESLRGNGSLVSLEVPRGITPEAGRGGSQTSGIHGTVRIRGAELKTTPGGPYLLR